MTDIISVSNTPSTEETLNHPAYPSAAWNLEPHKSGHVAAAKGRRGGPINIYYEIHGEGPTKLVFIMGLGGVITGWQRQTRYFGHDHGDRYSILIMDNRGMGRSDKPLMRYSTSEMARDVLEVIDHVGWTAKRELHVISISMGGMIAQELGLMIPDRLGSLTLLCTSAQVLNTATWAAWVAERMAFLLPKAPEIAVVDMSRKTFPDEWLAAPDAEDPPTPATTPRCGPAGGDGEYRKFDTNYQRYQAQELTKKRRPGFFTRQGFICQLVAIQWHYKSPEQLRRMADAVGRERMLVMHGTRDGIIVPSNGERLMDLVKPGTKMIVEGMGHAPIMERAKWLNELLDEKIQGWSQL